MSQWEWSVREPANFLTELFVERAKYARDQNDLRLSLTY